MRRGQAIGLALALASAGCGEPARRLASGPGADAAALGLVEALAQRFGQSSREPGFEALRPKLARAALVPSRVWDDEAAWPRRGEGWRAVDFAGYLSPDGYRVGVRTVAPEPTALGQYRGQLQLERIAGGRFQWSMREELAVGALRPAELAAALDALLRGAEHGDVRAARAAIRTAFPRASARLGLLLTLETLGLARATGGATGGATGIQLSVRLDPAGLAPSAPRYAAFLRKFLTPIRAHVVAADATGAGWWTLTADSNLWTLRLRVRDGSLVPLEGDADRRMPPDLRVTSDYATRMGRFGVGVRGLVAQVALTRTPVEKGFVAHFHASPDDWQLPFLVETLLGGPLHYPFDGPGSELGWSAVETPTGTRLVRHYRARVRENFVLRWLGGMTDRALSEFRAGAEEEADRYHGECLRAILGDLAELVNPRQ